jgi:hypothetical protein
VSSRNIPPKPTPEEVMARHYEVRTCRLCGFAGPHTGHTFRAGSSVCGYCEPSEPWPCDAWTMAKRLQNIREVLL